MEVILLVGATFAALNTVYHAYRGEWVAAAVQAVVLLALLFMLRLERGRYPGRWR